MIRLTFTVASNALRISFAGVRVPNRTGLVTKDDGHRPLQGGVSSRTTVAVGIGFITGPFLRLLLFTPVAVIGAKGRDNRWTNTAETMSRTVEGEGWIADLDSFKATLDGCTFRHEEPVGPKTGIGLVG